MRIQVQNQQLTDAYMAEKRKLEHDIIKDNMKNEVTYKIMNMVVSDGRDDPRPKYRFEQILDKYATAKKKAYKKVTIGGHSVEVEDLDGNQTPR